MSHSASNPPAGSSSGTTEEAPHRAGAFDIRTFIGSLIGIYGIVVVLVGLFATDDKQLAKSGGVNVNLWAGITMVVVAAFFFTWARLRPVIITADPEATEDDGPGGPAH